MLKRAADTDLIGAVRTVAGGRTFLSSDAQRDLMDEWLEGGRSEPDDPLTPRELEVVKLIAEAYTNRQIAETLKVSEKTVESHRANVLAKLGMRDRVELGALRDPAGPGRALADQAGGGAVGEQLAVGGAAQARLDRGDRLAARGSRLPSATTRPVSAVIARTRLNLTSSVA